MSKQRKHCPSTVNTCHAPGPMRHRPSTSATHHMLHYLHCLYNARGSCKGGTPQATTQARCPRAFPSPSPQVHSSPNSPWLSRLCWQGAALVVLEGAGPAFNVLQVAPVERLGQGAGVPLCNIARSPPGKQRHAGTSSAVRVYTKHAMERVLNADVAELSAVVQEAWRRTPAFARAARGANARPCCKLAHLCRAPLPPNPHVTPPPLVWALHDPTTPPLTSPPRSHLS